MLCGQPTPATVPPAQQQGYTLGHFRLSVVLPAAGGKKLLLIASCRRVIVRLLPKNRAESLRLDDPRDFYDHSAIAAKIDGQPLHIVYFSFDQRRHSSGGSLPARFGS